MFFSHVLFSRWYVIATFNKTDNNSNYESLLLGPYGTRQEQVRKEVVGATGTILLLWVNIRRF